MFTVLWHLAAGILYCLLALTISYAALIIVIYHQMLKFILRLPWFKWTTLEDLPPLGLSKRWAKFLLPIFKEKGYLEVRLLSEEEMSAYEYQLMDEFGFHPFTIHLHEFRLTKRKTRKEKMGFPLKDFISPWKPALA